MWNYIFTIVTVFTCSIGAGYCLNDYFKKHHWYDLSIAILCICALIDIAV